MFIECHDIDAKYPSYINADKISEIHIKDFISQEQGKSYGYVLEANVVTLPSGMRYISEVFHTKDEAEKALEDIVKKFNKKK